MFIEELMLCLKNGYKKWPKVKFKLLMMKKAKEKIIKIKN